VLHGHFIWGCVALFLVQVALLKWIYDYAVRRERAASILIADQLEVERALVQDAPSAIVVLDREGSVRRWNRAAERMFGWAEHEVLGRPAPVLTDGGVDRSAYDRALRGETAEVEVTRRGKDGRMVETVLNVSPLRNDRNEVTGVMEWMTGRTRSHELREQLRQAQGLAAIGRLAGGIVHDFNNLLAVICGHNGIILDDVSDRSPIRQHSLQIQKACERAQSLSGQLLAVKVGRPVSPGLTDLNGIVREVAGMLRNLIGKNIDWILSLNAEIGMVHADAGSVHEVLVNLILNARDAMPNGGTLTIETAQVTLDEKAAAACQGVEAGRYVLLAVHDTGVGFDEEAGRRLFEPFFTKKQNGSGLGLATVQRIVAESSGCIRTGSEPGKGARFEIYLPQIEHASATAAYIQ
jgi:two-component system, cell cycle sensor histidine kinase and response regulator CckA